MLIVIVSMRRFKANGMIVGLTNKDRTTPPDQAAVAHDGFFLDYDPARDGDTLVIRDQKKLAFQALSESAKQEAPVPAPKTRAVEDIPREELSGKRLNLPVRIEDTGETATLTLDAKTALDDVDAREDSMQRFLECLTK